MAETIQALPQEISWKLLAVSPDMMDTRFCNKRFPFRWRSSLAVWAFEPDPAPLPNELCEGRITFLKITATITGYQPTETETALGHASFPDVPTEELSRIIDQYFACYGALLNVAVFPNPSRKIVHPRVVVDFAEQTPGSELPNPFVSQGASFSAVGEPANRVVDRFPGGGDGRGELDVFRELAVTFAPTSRVEAKVAHDGAGVTMEAFRGATSVGSQAAGAEEDRVHELAIDGEGIDRVVLTAAEGEAVLLELAYFGTESRPFETIELPHVVDVEPKTRDLIQASSESGEILTSSKSNVKTNKSLTHTESSETGYKLASAFSKGQAAGNTPAFTVSGELTHKNTETEQDNWSVATDASRERVEKEGSTTQVSQLYNLLSSYHIGTNRAQFLMLARPHVLQATDHRTFVDGLRHIEGVQEFVLIVARPPEVAGLCVEVLLETGHFPEGLTPEEPPEEFDEAEEELRVTAFADNGFLSGSCSDIQTVHTVESGRVVDIRPHRGSDPGHPGLREIANASNGQANSSLENYNYQRNADATVQVTGRICGQSLERDKARFDRTYRVFTRSIEPKPNTAGPKVPIERLLITSRSLCACFRSGEACPQVDPPFASPFRDLVIVDEQPVAVSRALLTRRAADQSRVPAMKELLQQVRNALTTSGRLPRRRPFDEAPGFLESDYFKDQIRKVLPREHLQAPLADIPGLPDQVRDSLGGGCTVAEALDLDLAELSRRTGLSTAQAANARRKLLRIRHAPGTTPAAWAE